MKLYNKKSMTALLLAMTLTTAIATSSFAATTGTGDAGVVFTDGSSPEIIDPPVVPGNVFDGYGVNDLDFGSHAYTIEDEYYFSADQNSSTGIVIENGLADGFRVTVSRTDFSDAEGETLIGSELRLVGEAGKLISTTGNTSPAPTSPASVIVSDTAKTIFSALPNEGMGYWGNKWVGELDVVGATMRLGQAKATLTWDVTSGL